MINYNCTATVELELRGRLCSITAYGLGTYSPEYYFQPAESDMDIVALESDRGKPISARVEALITVEQWEYIAESLWEYEPC